MSFSSAGCLTEVDNQFAKDHQCSIITRNTNGISHIIFKFETAHTFYSFELTHMHGDCTACTLFMSNTHFANLENAFKVIQAYMSITGRISCMFSRKVYKNEISKYLELFKKFPIMGLHIHKSNRDPAHDTYMIEGILKCPLPIINTPLNMNLNLYKNSKDFDYHNTEKLNKINTEYKLQTV